MLNYSCLLVTTDAVGTIYIATNRERKIAIHVQNAVADPEIVERG